MQICINNTTANGKPSRSFYLFIVSLAHISMFDSCSKRAVLLKEFLKLVYQFQARVKYGAVFVDSNVLNIGHFKGGCMIVGRNVRHL
jgi:hypothetical protein